MKDSMIRKRDQRFECDNEEVYISNTIKYSYSYKIERSLINAIIVVKLSEIERRL